MAESGPVMAGTLTPPWGFRAQLTRPHDGDSFWMLCDTGFGGRHEPELRLRDVSAPEIHPMQPGGQETLDFVNGWMGSVQARRPGRRWPFWIEVVMSTSFEPDMRMTFTRYVATVWDIDTVREPGGQVGSLNQLTRDFLSGHPEWPPGD